MGSIAGTVRVQDRVTRVCVKLGDYVRRSCENPRWVMVFLFARFDTVRALSRRMAARRTAAQPTEPALASRLGSASSAFDSCEPDVVVDRLRSDGVHVGLQLDRFVVDEIEKFARSQAALANGDPNAPFCPGDLLEGRHRPTCEVMTGTFPDLTERLPLIKRLESDPTLLEIASRYLQTTPNVSSRLWWSFPAKSSRKEQLKHAQGTFHYDPDVDFAALKFFFYITEVDALCGPHVCVRGSHTKKRLRHKLTLFIGQPDDQIESYYGSENVLTLTGPKGFGIAEDPMCFHKGQPPTGGPRLMLEISCRLAAN